MSFVEAVEYREKLTRGRLIVNTSEACSFLRNPENYPRILKPAYSAEQITSIAVRRFLAACRLQAGEKGLESLGSIDRLWRRFPEILAEGDEKLLFFHPDKRLASLMSEADSVSRIPASALKLFLSRNPMFGRRVTPLQYKASMKVGFSNISEIVYSDRIDSVNRKAKNGRMAAATATIVEIANFKHRRNFDGALAFKLFMAKEGCKQSETIGGLSFRVYVWGILSGNCFQLIKYDKQMALTLAEDVAQAMKLGVTTRDMRAAVIRFDNTCQWSRVT